VEVEVGGNLRWIAIDLNLGGGMWVFAFAVGVVKSIQRRRVVEKGDLMGNEIGIGKRGEGIFVYFGTEQSFVYQVNSVRPDE
jgi:hypothetical protein